VSGGREELLLDGYAFVSVYDEVSSTMDVAKERLPEVCAPSGAAGLVVARSQTNGRGRQGRSWVSEAGAFMGTFLFPAPGPVALLSGYSLAVGVAVAGAMRSAGAMVQLKWPNDIVAVFDGELRKVGGILIEVQEGGDTRVLLVGLGLNLLSPPESVPHATSWQQLSGEAISLVDATERLSRALLASHKQFMSRGGLPAFRSSWEALSVFNAGQTVLTVEGAGENICGTYQGVDETGALLLSVGGQPRTVHSAHILSVVL
jgi:BirA family biotin operon repressor/biotin-[acetyl-CoA-carboxylase] ligase